MRDDRSWPNPDHPEIPLGRLLFSAERTAALHNGIFTIDPFRTFA